MKKLDLSEIVVRGAEWFSSLALLNIFWLVFSLPLFTIIPATDALFEVLHDWEWNQERSSSVFQHFKDVFKKNFKKSYKLGIPFLIIFILMSVDIYFLAKLTNHDQWIEILKYAFYTFSFLITLAWMYAYPLSKYLNENHLRVLLLGLFAVVGHPLISIGFILSLAILIVILYMWPSMLFFFSVSGVAWLATKATTRVIKKENEGKNQI